MTISNGHRPGLSDVQIQKLLEPINDKRIKPDQGGNPSMAGWDVKAHLLRMFGWGGFDVDVTRRELVHLGPAERGNGYDAVATCDVRLTIRNQAGQEIAHFEDGNVGEAQNQRTQGAAVKLAYKSAQTGAVKRVATFLGDQFGLSLGAKNAPGEPKRNPASPVVVRTVAWDKDDEQAGDLQAGGTVGGLGEDDDQDNVPGDAVSDPPPTADRRTDEAVDGWQPPTDDTQPAAASAAATDDDRPETFEQQVKSAGWKAYAALKELRNNGGFPDLGNLNHITDPADQRRALDHLKQAKQVKQPVG